jgi:aspartate/methionine/tyrosine aminotransferase
LRLPPFAVERWLARYEFRVPFNVAESCARPLTVAELGELAGAEAGLAWLRLGYVDAAGQPELREAIAALHPGARADDVLVTMGAIEANFLALAALCEPGDRVVVAVPAYQQLYEVPRGQGAQVVFWPLRREDGWRPDFDLLRDLLARPTKLVVVNFPHNPTGVALTPAELAELAEVCAQRGALLHSDEVYRGLPAPGRTPQPSAWSGGGGVTVAGSLSKAYGLPGLRLGWLLAPPAVRQRAQEIRDYTSICSAAASEALGLLALRGRSAILARQREHAASNRALVEAALAQSGGRLDWVPPQEGVVGCVRCACELTGRDFATRLAEAHGTLVVPGDCFGLDGCCFRLGFGYETDRLAGGLERLLAFARSL